MERTTASVLMTVFNDGSRFLEESILKVIEQKEFYDQFVIVNDGSTDNSKVIIEKYVSIKENKIDFIDRQENKGRVFSLNEGLKVCKNDLVFINDADDISEPLRFQKTISFFDSCRRKDNIAAIGGRGYIKTLNDINRYYRFYILKSGKIPAFQIYYGMPFIHSSCAYVREKLNCINGFSTELNSCIDYFTIVKLSSKYDIMGINDYLVTRNKDGKNFFTQSGIESRYQKNLDIIDKWKEDNYPHAHYYKILKTIVKFIWKMVVPKIYRN